MAFDATTLFSQAVAVDMETVKAQRAKSPQREGGGWVRSVLEAFDASPEEYLWVPLSALPMKEGSGEGKTEREIARTKAQNLNDQARKHSLNVTAKAETQPGSDSDEYGVGFTHEYPEKGPQGRKPNADAS